MAGDEPLSALPPEINEYLQIATMSLATVSSRGEPHAAPVYFAAGPPACLYFFSDQESRHARDIRLNPLAAATIYPVCEDWRDIRGLQLHGEVQRVSASQEWERAWGYYQAKFPFVSDLKEVVARNSLFVFNLRWVRLVDNRRGFGFKREWEFS
jgi:uncharacterized protein YhbP (UPF0306 family)